MLVPLVCVNYSSLCNSHQTVWFIVSHCIQLITACTMYIQLPTCEIYNCICIYSIVYIMQPVYFTMAYITYRMYYVHQPVEAYVYYVMCGSTIVWVMYTRPWPAVWPTKAYYNVQKPIMLIIIACINNVCVLQFSVHVIYINLCDSQQPCVFYITLSDSWVHVHV